MRQTLAELMTSLGCKRWPERWPEFYDEVMEDFDKNGCAFADPATYDELNDKYKAFPKYLDIYKASTMTTATLAISDG